VDDDVIIRILAALAHLHLRIDELEIAQAEQDRAMREQDEFNACVMGQLGRDDITFINRPPPIPEPANLAARPRLVVDNDHGGADADRGL
jgi:hypothetical protein